MSWCGPSDNRSTHTCYTACFAIKQQLLPTCTCTKDRPQCGPRNSTCLCIMKSVPQSAASKAALHNRDALSCAAVNCPGHGLPVSPAALAGLTPHAVSQAGGGRRADP